MRARVGWTSTVVVMGVLTPLPQPQARLCRGVVTFLHASFVHSAKRNLAPSLSGRWAGSGNHAGTIWALHPPSPGKVAHHGEVAGRVPRRDPFAIGPGLVFRHAVLSTRIQRQRDRPPLCDESLDAATGLGAGSCKIVLS